VKTERELREEKREIGKNRKRIVEEENDVREQEETRN